MTGHKRSKRFFNTEEKLKKRCIDNGIQYKPPADNEKDHITRSRRESLLLLLKDPDAMVRRNKKRDRDRKRELTVEQRTNKNAKERERKLTEEQRN